MPNKFSILSKQLSLWLALGLKDQTKAVDYLLRKNPENVSGFVFFFREKLSF